MKIVEKILGVVAGVGAVLSALFYVLFQQKKDENKLIQEQYNNMKADADAQKKASDIKQSARQDAIKEMKENEQKIADAKNGNHLANFDALNDILSK